MKVFTDHESLATLLKGSNVMPSDRVARQVEFLAGFDLEISYLKGGKNGGGRHTIALTKRSIKQR